MAKPCRAACDCNVCMIMLSDQTYDRTDPSWQALLHCAMLCSRTEFKPDQNNIPILRRQVLCTQLLLKMALSVQGALKVF